MGYWSNGIYERIKTEGIRNIAPGSLGESVSGLYAYWKSKQIAEEESEKWIDWRTNWKTDY